MVQAVLVGLTALVFAVISPMVLLTPVEAEPPPNQLLIMEPEQAKQDTTIRLYVGGQVTELPLEEYLIGVVLSEMPASFEHEALKAQAVAARTFAVRQKNGGKHSDFDLCDQSSCCQAWTGENALRQKLGGVWQTYWNKASRAVKATEGEVLTYQGSLIDAVYFSCSGGQTEDAAAVWGTEVPYLQSVKSPGEEPAAKYESEVTISEEDFIAILRKENSRADFSEPPAGWFGSILRTQGGGVASMEIGGYSFSGTRLRSLFGLNSTDFTVSVTGQGICFSVRGYGHRVGMSQYGANAMASKGKTYDEILLHYYSGAELTALT